MQQADKGSDTTLYGPDGRELPDGGTGGSDGDWADVGRQIERLLRRDVARIVGAEEAADWGAIKDAMVGRVRGQAESIDRTEVGRRVEEIGRTVEEQLRCGMTQATGAGRDADWPTIARTVRERVERAIDPGKLPFPGGSGTAANAEDVNVPAAPPSGDRPPTPARAGGEDTGLPTVTQDVDAPAQGPPPGPRPPA
jgi:hypothetical protein